MQIPCVTCGRTACEAEPPEFKGPEVSIVRRFLSGAGIDVGPDLEAILNPTPDAISKTFKVRCPHGC